MRGQNSGHVRAAVSPQCSAHEAPLKLARRPKGRPSWTNFWPSRAPSLGRNLAPLWRTNCGLSSPKTGLKLVLWAGSSNSAAPKVWQGRWASHLEAAWTPLHHRPTSCSGLACGSWLESSSKAALRLPKSSRRLVWVEIWAGRSRKWCKNGAKIVQKWCKMMARSLRLEVGLEWGAQLGLFGQILGRD